MTSTPEKSAATGDVASALKDTDLAGFRSKDKQLAFRVKGQFADNKNYTPRSQACNRVSSALFCIHLEDVMLLIILDLACGSVFFGCLFFVNIQCGITQGSLLCLGVADMVLSVIEERNSMLVSFEAKRWMSFLVRRVDVLWFCSDIICCLWI